ncbi:uncharacterized protein LOC108412522 isoform X2 [Pygocentrus nattereri]|uniref:uncharacterized protein LOC108412522 isoform X2 n=1 Tax=Pygocentrus nattereri TaxID=42514 RepID=UPI0008142B90|nr:uncharacterized protein LOC108412522 isoform X2 [Pygocentrus nattereri]
MDMKLFILSVVLGFARGQGELTVSLFPGFPPQRLYVGDEVTLRCKDGGSILTSDVKWKKGGVQLSDSINNGKLEIPVVTPLDSGTYTCESGSKKSKDMEIRVLDMLPLASLSVLNRGRTVLGKGGAVLMELYVEEGLKDWWCRYTEGDGENWLPLLPDKWTNSNRSVVIHAEVGQEGSRIFWCMNIKATPKEQRPRSNAVKLTATEKMVMLQISQRPAWSGETVSLSCDVWGGAHVENAVFYQDGKEVQKGSKDTYDIPNIAKDSEGEYTCKATYKFTHINPAAAERSNMPSDQQVLRVIGDVLDGPPLAHLDCNTLTCECQKCSNPGSYRWHHIPQGQTRTVVLEESGYYISSRRAGKYTCSVKIPPNGQSRHSNECILKEDEGDGPNLMVLVVVVLFVVGLLFLLLGLYKCKRNNDQKSKRQKKMEEGADGGYEEVGTEKKGAGAEGEYELLKLSTEEKDKAQYDTLKGQSKGQGEGGYEALKVGQAGADVYHTLKEQGQGEGGYEALKTAQAEVYHTLKEGQDEGKGEYQALKTGEGETTVYHTLKDQAKGQAEGKGEYEALKTTQAQVYQTLGQKQESGQAEGQKAKEESPYEELKAEKKEKE